MPCIDLHTCNLGSNPLYKSTIWILENLKRCNLFLHAAHLHLLGESSGIWALAFFLHFLDIFLQLAVWKQRQWHDRELASDFNIYHSSNGNDKRYDLRFYLQMHCNSPENLKNYIWHLYGKELHGDTRQFEHLQDKCAKLLDSWAFLQHCRDQKVIPRFAPIKHPTDTMATKWLVNRTGLLLYPLLVFYLML